MKLNVEAVGGHELREKLASLPAEIEQRAAKAIADAVDQVTSDAKADVPVDSGDLQESIVGTADGLSGQVEVGEHYGTFVEHGTSRRPARPFLGPAAEQERTRLPKRIADEMGDLGG